MNAIARVGVTEGAAMEGETRAAASLAPLTWFRVGGPAEVLASPRDTADLARFFHALPLAVPVFALGAGSNLIVRDGGIDGVVVRLGRSFATIEPDGDDALIVGGAASDALVARRAAEAGLSGLEFLAGIPGTIGGAVAMNAGAYGGDMASVLDWAEIVLRNGEIARLAAEALAFSYRTSALPPEAVVVRVRLRGRPGDRSLIAARIAEIRASREATQPVKERTGGSTFRNPDPAVSSLKAWELIDQAGCRGLSAGGASVSRLHTNFLLNTGGATGAELESLGETVRRRVAETSGVALRWEIRRVGRRLGAPAS